MCEDESMCEDDGEDTDDEDADEESESLSSSGSTQKSLALPATTLTGIATLVAGLSGVSQGMERMVPLGNSP